MNYSPWPLPGKWLRWERNQAWKVHTSYGGKWPPFGKQEWSAEWGKWWFLSVDIGPVQFYIGHKPVNLLDPKFYAPEDFNRWAPCVEFSIRLSWGEVS